MVPLVSTSSSLPLFDTAALATCHFEQLPITAAEREHHWLGADRGFAIVIESGKYSDSPISAQTTVFTLGCVYVSDELEQRRAPLRTS